MENATAIVKASRHDLKHPRIADRHNEQARDESQPSLSRRRAEPLRAAPSL